MKFGRKKKTMDKQKRIEQINTNIAQCFLCPLCQTRTNTVPGEGNINAKIMIVGEGPGEQNDLYGRPFIGRGGQILDTCLKEANLIRTNLYLTNIIKCRMPHNATPSNAIVRICSDYLIQQINIIHPNVIVALGTAATKFFVEEKNIKLADLCGKILAYRDTKLICTYHPSSIRYNKSARSNIIEALRLADLLTR